MKLKMPVVMFSINHRETAATSVDEIQSTVGRLLPQRQWQGKYVPGELFSR
jgi:hypothetical protein